MTDNLEVPSEDVYISVIRRFNDQTGITRKAENTAESHAQKFDVIEEELDELDEAISLMEMVENNRGQFTVTEPDDYRAEIAEELADVIISAFSMGIAQDIDVRRAFLKKMQYNLHKTGNEWEGGKVQDDVNIEKPDFDDCLLENREDD